MTEMEKLLLSESMKTPTYLAIGFIQAICFVNGSVCVLRL